ncbi:MULTISPECIES: hypothetical protein [unclassified Sporolactobacillus]|uniref:hypothetical protein n=1 Tax=unclassified Sporolactobacillus TaxID=2628533 RepID=UPI0023679415|nr:hypothetical protein [Sporolactobacillus sp. CQH2019]MDD9150434.1 hypothetical protein [Sporolactobacillus sp. CQH2019]
MKKHLSLQNVLHDLHTLQADEEQLQADLNEQVKKHKFKNAKTTIQQLKELNTDINKMLNTVVDI